MIIFLIILLLQHDNNYHIHIYIYIFVIITMMCIYIVQTLYVYKKYKHMFFFLGQNAWMFTIETISKLMLHCRYHNVHVLSGNPST